MGSEQRSFRVLTLLLAITEQALGELAELDPPADAELVAQLERSRDMIQVELAMGRFHRRALTPN
jgi:hypothetical protein